MLLQLSAMALSLAPIADSANESSVTFACISEQPNFNYFMLGLSESGRFVYLHRHQGVAWPDEKVLLLNNVRHETADQNDGVRTRHLEISGVSDPKIGPSTNTQYRLKIDIQYPKDGLDAGVNNPLLVYAELSMKDIDIKATCLSDNPSRKGFE